MKSHQHPEPNPIDERFKFNSRVRAHNESVTAYIAALRQLTEYCDYGESLDNMLRDRLVCGINHERIQQRLLSEGKTLTLSRALDLAQAMESAAKTPTTATSAASAVAAVAGAATAPQAATWRDKQPP